MAGFQTSAARLLIAALLSALVGVERQWRGHPAGMRTHMLLGIGAALATLVGEYGFPEIVGRQLSAPDRIAAQIVSGIGFLGAGTILKQRSGVHGLTTAASLWAVATIGIAVGAGLWAAASLTTAVLIIILVPLAWVERRLRPQPMALSITLTLSTPELALAAVEHAVQAAGGSVQALQRRRAADGSAGQVIIEVATEQPRTLSAWVTALEGLPGIASVAVESGSALLDQS
jgi:putative Mg2+ transporter-C (MgtC) family protein